MPPKGGISVLVWHSRPRLCIVLGGTGALACALFWVAQAPSSLHCSVWLSRPRLCIVLGGTGALACAQNQTPPTWRRFTFQTNFL